MIRAVMIVEMLGGPKEFVKESMQKHVSKLGGYRETEVISIKTSEPKLVDKKKNLYTLFSEVEFTVPRFSLLGEIVFDFMPSSVEVVEPGKVSLESFEMTEFLNGVSGRLHKYDDIAKIAHLRIKQLTNLLIEAEKNGFLEFKKEEARKSKKKPKTQKKKKQAD